MSSIDLKKMEDIIGIILTIGMLISACLVFIGGCIYLWQNGHELIATELLQTDFHTTKLKHIWQTAFSFSALGFIQIGLLALVGTQIVRVGLLLWFYSITKDYKFSIISLFILIILVYSLIWRI